MTNNERGPALSANARKILDERYVRRDANGDALETHEGVFRRVADAVAMGEDVEARGAWAERFYHLMSSLRFLPNSPTLVNAGLGRGCLSACFVVTPDDDMNSIMDVAHAAAMIEKWGGGIGFGLSKLRPKGDAIATTHGQACGPIAVMRLYSAVGATLTQGAFRLGAHMAQMRDSHPDVLDFIHCKDGDDTLQNFNISVQITDAFMEAVRTDGEWELRSPRDSGDGPSGEVMSVVNAREMWRELCESAWKTGDPGVVFMDRVWETAPNPQMGLIETSNPCGEELLEDYGNCCLGSINLDAHVVGGKLDWDALDATVRLAVRFLDDVIEVNEFPLPKLREVNLATRRIGLGVMGWADALVRMGVAYDSSEGIELARTVAGSIRRVAWRESEALAAERGAFPEYERSALKGFLLAEGIGPVRHSSVTTVAPTGTISRIAGCSSGIEPHFSLAWWSNVLHEASGGSGAASEATVRLLDMPAPLRESLDDTRYAAATRAMEEGGSAGFERKLREMGVDLGVYRTAMEIGSDAHVDVQAAWQSGATNSVSKTINLPNEASVDDVARAFERAYDAGCKAVTVYRDGSKSEQVLETGAVEESTVIVAERVPRRRPKELFGVNRKIATGHGVLFANVTFDEEGSPFELFMTLGKAGGCDNAGTEVVGRLISTALRSGIPLREIADQLSNVQCCPLWDDGSQVLSPYDGLARWFREIDQNEGLRSAMALVSGGTLLRDNERAEGVAGVQTSLALNGEAGERNGYGGVSCRVCGSRNIVYQEGCEKCLDCGESKCG